MNQPATSRVSRRTVARGAAWTLPVVAFAAAAPAATASTAADTCSVTVAGVGTKYNAQGDKTVTVTFTMQNSGQTAQSVAIASVVGPANATWSNITPESWMAAPGQSQQIVTLKRSNNATGDATVLLKVCGTTDHSATVPISK